MRQTARVRGGYVGVEGGGWGWGVGEFGELGQGTSLYSDPGDLSLSLA